MILYSFYETVGKKVKWYHIIAVYIVQIVIFQIMNQIIFPVVEKCLGSNHIFDMVKQGYDSQYVENILSSMDETSRNMYLHVQMPLDFIYPVIMAAVFFLIFAKAWHKFWYVFCIIPLLLIAFDWAENICLLLLFSCNTISDSVVNISSFCTQAKAIVGDYVLYYLAIISTSVSVIKFIANKYKQHSI